MGLFKNLRQTAKAVSAMVADVQAANDEMVANAPITILNPTPQDEVDRLLAAGGVTRGVVVRASHPPQHGERSAKFRVNVKARARLADGALGETADIKIWTSWQVAALLDPGLEIPVLVDRATGTVTDIPTDELRSELEDRFDEAAERQSGWVVDADFQGMSRPFTDDEGRRNRKR